MLPLFTIGPRKGWYQTVGLLTTCIIALTPIVVNAQQGPILKDRVVQANVPDRWTGYVRIDKQWSSARPPGRYFELRVQGSCEGVETFKDPASTELVENFAYTNTERKSDQTGAGSTTTVTLRGQYSGTIPGTVSVNVTRRPNETTYSVRYPFPNGKMPIEQTKVQVETRATGQAPPPRRYESTYYGDCWDRDTPAAYGTVQGDENRLSGSVTRTADITPDVRLRITVSWDLQRLTPGGGDVFASGDSKQPTAGRGDTSGGPGGPGGLPPPSGGPGGWQGNPPQPGRPTLPGGPREGQPVQPPPPSPQNPPGLVTRRPDGGITLHGGVSTTEGQTTGGTQRDEGSKRYVYGRPDPALVFLDGFSRGLAECFEQNLAQDLATAPFARVKQLERFGEAIRFVGAASTIDSLIQDLRQMNPNAEDYELGKQAARLVCDGNNLRNVMAHAAPQGPQGKPQLPSPDPSKTQLPAKAPGAGVRPGTAKGTPETPPSASAPQASGMPSTVAPWRPPTPGSGPGTGPTLPTSWGNGQPNQKSDGWRWLDPANPRGNGVRIDKGDPGAVNPSQRVDHVVVRSEGKVIGRDGKEIVGSIRDDATNAHIPYNEWITWRTWNAP